MNDLRTAAQRLIDLQDMDRVEIIRQFGHNDDWLIACRRARDVLHAALAEPVQEPVAGAVLGPLPEPAQPAQSAGYMPGCPIEIPETPDYYTAEQMREYAMQALAEPEPVQEPVASDGRIVIEWRDGVPYLNGQEIGPGTLEIRRDGTTYRSAERVAVQPAQPLSRNIRRKALAQALRGMADGFEQKTYWFRPDPLVMSTLRRAADELDKEGA